MKRVALLTSGGDAPGMNAAIRAVVRTGAAAGWEMIGVRHGFRGLLDADLISLSNRDVGGIMHEAGTVLGSSRSREYEAPGGCKRALAQLEGNRLDALVVIGGNGSQSGAHCLSELGFPVVGVASTIDNDLVGSDYTIGTDTALNIALEAIDRLRVTAYALRRISLVEVMGRDCGYLALMAAIAGGAEAVVIPEEETDPDALIHHLVEQHHLKDHAMVVVAEGAEYSGQRLADHLSTHHADLGFKIRLTVLGHVQRGGRPTASDRLLGTRLGAAAVDKLLQGQHGVLVGLLDDKVAATPLEDCVGRTKAPDHELFALAEVLSR